MYLHCYPNERHSNGQSSDSGRIEENAGDIQYILETLTGMEERLSKIESCCNQGNGTILCWDSWSHGDLHFYFLELFYLDRILDSK